LNSICDNSIPVEWALVDDSKEAFETFVKAHMKKAYFVALGMVGNHDDALELSQDAFSKAYQHRGTLNAKGKFYPWFYQILRNLCISHLRKRKHRRTLPIDMPDGQTIELPSAPGFEPDSIAERNEAKDLVWRAIGSLEPKHREVIILRHFQNLSYEEMAQLLFCNKGTVTSRLYYARKRLKEVLEKEKGGQPV
jgi:RNA polymerase sigma-70 factor (ECF subfamily)